MSSGLNISVLTIVSVSVVLNAMKVFRFAIAVLALVANAKAIVGLKPRLGAEQQ